MEHSKHALGYIRKFLLTLQFEWSMTKWVSSQKTAEDISVDPHTGTVRSYLVQSVRWVPKSYLYLTAIIALVLSFT